MDEKKKIIFGFDIGTGSLGEAVRMDDSITHADSLLLPQTFAETKDQTKRRGAHRNREAHLAREAWLKEICHDAGIEVLEGRRERGKELIPGDPRLEREFPARGDSTCYTSSLLRIKLLRGEPLEGWQVYKALHSAIQRRGYDPDVAWKSQDDAQKDSDEKETQENLMAFEALYEGMLPGREACHYLCFFDAWRMGVWDPATDEIKLRIDNQANGHATS